MNENLLYKNLGYINLLMILAKPNFGYFNLNFQPMWTSDGLIP